MEDSNGVAEQAELWRYAPLSEYSVPSAFASRARGLGQLWKTVRDVLRSKESRDEPQERRRPDAEALADLVPRFDVDAASRALASELGEWPSGASSSGPTRVVIGPPGAHTKQVLEALARHQGWVEISPPPRAQIDGADDGGQEFLDTLAPDSQPAVIAQLERWLLRTERGLKLMRRLLVRLRERSSPLLIGCDSWAWELLEATVGVGDLATEPLALAALDAERLSAWLGPPLSSSGLACRAATEPDEVVFQAGSGGGDGSDADGVRPSPTLVKLAAAARGNPGLALELWRGGLRLTNDTSDGVEQDRVDTGATVWAAPESDLEVLVPAELEPTHKFVLHAALLHGGLERELLGAVVPFAEYELLRRVRDLIHQGLLVENGGCCSIPLAAYGAVRRSLDSEGFLVDAF